jgi:hypothetical protein
MRRTIHLATLLSIIILSPPALTGGYALAWGRATLPAQQDACPPAGPGPGSYKGSCPTHSNQPNCHPLELFEITRHGSSSRIISRATLVYHAPDGSLTKPQNCTDLTTSHYRQNPAGGNWFWEYDTETHTGSGYATMHDQFSPAVIQMYGDKLASLPQNFENNRADPEMDWSIRTRYSPIPALYDRYTYERPCFVRVTYDGTTGDFRVAENGPALWTGKVLDLSPAALAELGIHSGGPHFVTFEILEEGCPAIERRPDYTAENTRAELLAEGLAVESDPLVLQGDRDDSRWVKYRNLGDITWFREDDVIQLSDLDGMPSLVYCNEWRSVTEPGTFVEQQVLPGEVATFPIPVCRHSMTPDEYSETFALKAMTGVPFWATGDGRQDAPAVEAGAVTLRVVSEK